MITAITAQQRKSGRYSVYIDRQFAFGVSEQQVVELALRNGQTLTEAQVRTLERQLEFDRVKRSALRSIEMRMHSEHELRQKLRRKEFDPAQIEDVIQWLAERSLLDDRQFADRWVETGRAQRGVGDYRLRQELLKKGLAKEVTEEALLAQNESEEDQVRRAAEWASRKYESLLSTLGEQSHRDRILSAIIRRGFSYGVAKKALGQLSAERAG